MAEFLVVELDNPQGLLRSLTRRLPGTALDLFLLAPGPGEPPVVDTFCQLRGARTHQAALLRALATLDPSLKPLPAPEGTVRMNLRLAPQAMSPDAKIVAAFAVEHGLRSGWACVQDGVVSVRLLLPQQVPAGLADALRDRLAAAAFAAQVDVEPADQGALVERLQALVGALVASRRPQGF